MIHIKRVIHIIIIPAVNKNTPPWFRKGVSQPWASKRNNPMYQMPFSLKDNCPEATETEAMTFLSGCYPEIGSFHPEAEAEVIYSMTFPTSFQPMLYGVIPEITPGMTTNHDSISSYLQFLQSHRDVMVLTPNCPCLGNIRCGNCPLALHAQPYHNTSPHESWASTGKEKMCITSWFSLAI